MKINKRLSVFAILYNLVSLYVIYQIAVIDEPATTLGYIINVPIFWIVAGIILGVLISKKLIKVNTKTEIWLFIFSTPLPLIVLLFLMYLLNPSF